MSNGDSNGGGDGDDRGSGNAAVLIGIVVLLAIAWFVLHLYEKNQQMENCRLEGRRDCNPITIPSQ
jgi:hypothetical protein